MNPIIVTHGGVGHTPDLRDGTNRAALVGMKILSGNGFALDAVEAAIVTMEDDERFNAGTGSYIRLNGAIEMDALLMDSQGNCGAVGAIRDVKNPISVARKVMDTPHILLAADGAVEFARKSGFSSYDPKTENAVKRFERAKSDLENGNLPEWASEWREFGFTETVGAVAMDAKGGFAGGSSSGGLPIVLQGRIGDSALVGSGVFAGVLGAVTVTGVGEDIMRTVLSKVVYDRLKQDMTPQEACDWGLSLFEEEIPIGIIAVSVKGWGMAARFDMPWSVFEG